MFVWIKYIFNIRYKQHYIYMLALKRRIIKQNRINRLLQVFILLKQCILLWNFIMRHFKVCWARPSVCINCGQHSRDILKPLKSYCEKWECIKDNPYWSCLQVLKNLNLNLYLQVKFTMWLLSLWCLLNWKWCFWLSIEHNLNFS